MKNIFKNFLSGVNPWDLFALKIKALSENKKSIKTYIPANISLVNLFFYSFLPILWIWVTFRWINRQKNIREFFSNNITFWVMKQFALIKSRLRNILKDALCFETILSFTVLVSGFYILRKIDYRKGFISLSVEKYLPALSLPSQNLSWQTLEHIVAKQKHNTHNLSNSSVLGTSLDKNKLFLNLPKGTSKKSEIFDTRSPQGEKPTTKVFGTTVKKTTDYNAIDQIDVFRDSIWIHCSSNWNKEQQQTFIGLYPHKISQKTKASQQQSSTELLQNFSLKLQKRKKKQYSEKGFIQQKLKKLKKLTRDQKNNVTSISRLSNTFRPIPNLYVLSKDKRVLTKKSLLAEKQVSNWSQIYVRDWMGLFPEVKPNFQKKIFTGPDNVFQLKNWLETWYSCVDEFPTKLSQNYKAVPAVEKINIPKNQLPNFLFFDNKESRLKFYKKYYFLQNELNNLHLKYKVLPCLEWFATSNTKNSKKVDSQVISREELFDKILSEVKPRAMSGYLYPDMERKQIESRYLQSLYRKGFYTFFWVHDTDKSMNQQSVSKLGVDFPIKTHLPSSFLSEFSLKFENFLVPKLSTALTLKTIRKNTVLLGFDEILYDAYGIVTDSITKDIKISNSKSLSKWAFDSFGVENPMSNRKSDSQLKNIIKNLVVTNYLKNHLATFKGYRHDFDSTLTLLKEKIKSQSQSEKLSEISTNKLSDEIYQDVSKLKPKFTNLKKSDIFFPKNTKKLKFNTLREREKATKKTPDEYKIAKLALQWKKERIDCRVLPYEETKKIAYLRSKTWIKFIKRNQPSITSFIEDVSKLLPKSALTPDESKSAVTPNKSKSAVTPGKSKSAVTPDKSKSAVTPDKCLYRFVPFLSVPEVPSDISSKKKENVEKKAEKETESKNISTLQNNKLISDTSSPKKQNQKDKINRPSDTKNFLSPPDSPFNYIEWPLTFLDRQCFPWSFLVSQQNSRLVLESTSSSSKISPKINVHYFPYPQTLSTPIALDLTNVSGMYQRFWTQYEYQSRNFFDKIWEKVETSSWLQQFSLILVNGKPNQTQVSDCWEPLSKYSWLASTKLVCLIVIRKLVRYLYITYVKEVLSAFLSLLLAAGLLDDEFIEQLGLKNSQDHFRVFKKLETKFQNIAGIDNLLSELGDVVWFFRNAGRPFSVGKTIPKGILLVGPPGTGKTFLVQAIAGEGEVPVLVQSGSSFFDLKSKKHAGEQLKILFEKAREFAPCILFIDEIDSVGGARQNIMGHPMGDGILELILEPNKNLEADLQDLDILPPKPILETKSDTPQNWDSQGETIFSPSKKTNSLNKRMALLAQGQPSKKQKMSLLMQFLVEMDGLKALKGIVVIGATNRPTSLDPALLRPGRFNKIIYLELPRKQKRIEILKLYSQNLGIQKPLSWDYFAHLTSGWSAAELASAMNESSMHAIIHETIHTVETMERGIDIMSNLITQTGKQSYGNSQDPFKVIRRAFYQAGKALVSAILVEHPLLVVLHLWPRPTNSRQNRRMRTAPQINSQITRRPLEIRIIGFYAGKASELLVLGGNTLTLRGRSSDRHFVSDENLKTDQGFIKNTGLKKQKYEKPTLDDHTVKKKQSTEIGTVTTIVSVSPVSYFYKAKRFLFLFRGLAYLKSSGEKKDFKSIQYLLNSKKKNRFQESENQFKKMILNSAIERMTLWHSDLGTEDLSSASSLASLMIEKWYFYSKTIAGRRITTIFSDQNSKHFREEKRLQAITQLADENDDIEILKNFSFSSYHRDQEWFLPAWWQMRTRQDIQKATKTFDEWFRIYISDPVQKLRNIEWIPGETYFHKNQALKNCLPKPVNVNLSFNNLYKFDREYIYHGLLMNSFNKAFLLLDKNRELLDYFADTLICSEILRQNEIISIVSTFGYSVNDNKILLSKSK